MGRKTYFEKVSHGNAIYHRIDPEMIDIARMTKVQKLGDVIAIQVKTGKVKVVTRTGFNEETINYAEAGDWIVYNIGASALLTTTEVMLGCSKKIIKGENFHKLYSEKGENIILSDAERRIILADILSDNSDNSDFTDYTFVSTIEKHVYIGKPVFVCKVPFNFVIRAPWGTDQFIKAGGMIIHNINTSHGSHKDIYGVEGAHKGVSGEFEKTYKLADDKRKGVIVDTFQVALRCDRSPIAGIQFTNRDMQRAYERIGKDCPRLGIYVDE